MNYWDEIYIGLKNTGILEWLAVITGILYVILAARKIIYCWFFALISTAIFTFLCIEAGLYIESSLQIFYFVMAIYGWINWQHKANQDLPIKRWPLSYHLINIILSSILTFTLGYLMSEFTNQKNPYLDAFTTVFSLAATFMVARRILENWIYWIVIDIAAAFLYSGRGLYVTGFHYIIFTIIAIFAWYKWYTYYKSQLTHD
ncbi:MAG: nicotinamide riboside transporter PnuC [Brumimicrobium sp.]|nr:nicotinamide riboside transporter PnuC [Brumimicrobium sp.]